MECRFYGAFGLFGRFFASVCWFVVIGEFHHYDRACTAI